MRNKVITDILNHIQPNPTFYTDGFKDYYKACNEIATTARAIGHPFTNMNGSIHLYLGTHWEPIPDYDVKVFLKFAFQELSGDLELASKRELIEGMAKQFPYTVMWLNTNPPATKINFRNITLDLDTLKELPHKPDDYFTYTLGYDYDKHAECPMFMKYIQEVLPETQAQQVIAEYISWIFVPDLKLEKILFLYGSGCNGKSVLVEIMENLVGQENVANESLSDIADNPNARANLVGKLLNSCSDIGTSIAKPDVIKRTASGEAISYKKLYQDVSTTNHYAKSVFCLNELPKTTDHSDGFFRRFLIVPFERQIPKSKIDPKLPQKIISAELPGIMNWVIEGRKRLVKNQAFTDSPLIEKAVRNYKRGAKGSLVSLILP